MQPAPLINAQFNSYPRFAATSVTIDTTKYTLVFDNVPAGSYLLFLQASSVGYAYFSSIAQQTFVVKIGTVATANPVATSFVGG